MTQACSWHACTLAAPGNFRASRFLRKPFFVLITLLGMMILMNSVNGGDIPGEVDSMPGWLGAVHRIDTSAIEDRKGGDQSVRIDSKKIIQLSAWHPRAYLYKNFLSDEECDHLIQKATPRLERSEVTDEHDESGVVSDIRTSWGMFIDKEDDEVVKSIEQRISSWTFLPIRNQEALQVLRYTRGQKYEPHHDYFDEPVRKQQGGHRYATVLMYLSSAGKGGETAFPNVPDPTPKDDSWSDCAKGVLAVKPMKGDALLFFSLYPDGSPDENSLHFACPVLEGVKWSAPKWIHTSDFDTVLPDSSDSSCVDKNALCESWASEGECTKNLDFMVGTKGYYGACRKACGTCKPSAIS